MKLVWRRAWISPVGVTFCNKCDEPHFMRVWVAERSDDAVKFQILNTDEHGKVSKESKVFTRILLAEHLLSPKTALSLGLYDQVVRNITLGLEEGIPIVGSAPALKLYVPLKRCKTRRSSEMVH